VSGGVSRSGGGGRECQVVVGWGERVGVLRALAGVRWCVLVGSSGEVWGHEVLALEQRVYSLNRALIEPSIEP
jgi:hypothetical protein